MKTRIDSLEGVLLGTALGDALGLAAEGMSARAIRRRFGPVERFHLLGRTGFVSDDTEQSALVAEALIAGGADSSEVVRAFRRGLLGWFARLPFGIGFGTLRACLRIAVGLRRTGTRSAGNGAAMRAAVVGVALAHDDARRCAIGRALAEVTHVDPRAVDGATFVGELAAFAARADPDAARAPMVVSALGVLVEPALRTPIDRALRLAESDVPDAVAAREIGTTGFVVHSVPFATFVFVRHGADALAAARAAVAVGGDTDSNAAIACALAGALGGASRLPASLVARIHDGPFGPTHLRALAAAIDDERVTTAPRYSALAAMLRNLALFPVVIAHGLRRLVPI